MNKPPKISVIIASVNGMPAVAECLTALFRQENDLDFEVIVADKTKDATESYIRKNFPQVKLLKAGSSVGIPALRAMALAKAEGEFIAVTEDHCIVPANWLAKIAAAHKTGYDVVGGAVENGSPKRLVDWAVFLCEYGSFMPPLAGGETLFVTGNNTSYKRGVLEKVEQSLIGDYWEYFLHRELRREGFKFLSVPDLIVSHKKEFGFFYFLSQRFYYSRSFAAMRARQSSALEKFIYLIYTPLLPFHQTWRIACNVIRKKRNLREFLLSFPMLLVFMASYAVGEFVGQIFGTGESLAKIE